MRSLHIESDTGHGDPPPKTPQTPPVPVEPVEKIPTAPETK